jgi:hypothetical protein
MFAMPTLPFAERTIRQHKRHGALPALALLCAGAAQAATFTPLYNFGMTDASQNFPAGQLALGRDGNFYGAMNNNRAQIFKISLDGVAPVSLTVTGASKE